MIVSNLVVFLLLIIAPLYSYIMIGYLKRNKSEKNRIISYLLNMTILWLLFVVVVYEHHSRIFAYDGPYVSKAAVPYVITYIVIMTLLPFVFIKNSIFRSALLTAYSNKIHVYPLTGKERLWFVPTAITVGICEEVLYRSFLLNYLHDSPWHLSVLAAVLVGNILFGLIHYHQGMGGIINAVINGLVFSYIFISTGYLIIPIILHIFFDIKIVGISQSLSYSQSKNHIN